MRTILVALALILPTAAAGIAAATHPGGAWPLKIWCSFNAPNDDSCSSTQPLTHPHVMSFGANLREGVSLPLVGTIKVTFEGTTDLGAPFSKTVTCPPLGIAVMNQHRSCVVEIHTNFQGQPTLTVEAGPALLGQVEGWVATMA